MTQSRPAVFLDRDGVLNRLVTRDGGLYSPRRPEDFELFPWTQEALQLLADHGYLLVVVTNQPDVARGHMSIEDLDKMHERLRAAIPIDAIYVCPHDSSDGCGCRKPMPGMFLSAAEDLGIDVSRSWTIGDRANDLMAGRVVGTRVIHVSSGQESTPPDRDVISTNTLLSAAHYIIKDQNSLEK